MSTLSLNSAVAIAISGEQGVIIARMESIASEQQYRVHYKAANGEAKTEWFHPNQLQRLDTKPEQRELPLSPAPATQSINTEIRKAVASLQGASSGKAKPIKPAAAVTAPAAKPARTKTAKRATLDERLVAFLANRPNRYTTNELAKRFKVTYWTMRSAIKRTNSQGLVVKEREVAA